MGKDGSAAPSTAATDGTPQPTPSGPPTRIKLVSNSASASAGANASNGAGSQVNGGSSGVQSDVD
jgi:ATP-dependent helicase STH1/SNF2